MEQIYYFDPTRIFQKFNKIYHMSQQQNVQVADPINQNQPESPKKETDSQNSAFFSLSPKQDSIIKAKNQTSPAVKKNKLDVLKKLIQKKLEEKQQVQNKNKNLSETLQQKQNEEKLLKQKISNSQSTQQATINFSTVLNEKQNEWKNKKQEIQRDIQRILLQSAPLQRQHHDLYAKISDLNLKKAQNSEKASQKIAQNEYQVFELQKKLSDLKTKHAHNQNSLQNTKNALNQEKKTFQAISKKAESIAIGSSSNYSQLTSQIAIRIVQRQNEQKHRQNLIKEINQKIKHIEGQTENQSVSNNAQVSAQLNELKKQINDLKAEASKSKNEITQQIKKYDQIVKSQKNQEKDSQKLKNKNHELNQKLKKLEHEKEDLQKCPKKVKYQQRPPQEVQQKKRQQEKICKKIQLVKIQIQNQKKAYENLIPPTIIQGLKAKITKIQEDSEKLNYLTKANKSILEENKKLDQTKEALQWEVNPDIKTSQINRQKEETKSKFLEEQVSQIRKRSVQLNNKLQEYIKSYPDFKPQKKQKKVQPVVVAPVNVKSPSVKQEQKQPKKKKGNTTKQDSVIEQKKEKSPAIEELKQSPVKKEQKKIQVPKVVQKKQSTNTQNGKNKKNKKSK